MTQETIDRINAELAKAQEQRVLARQDLRTHILANGSADVELVRIVATYTDIVAALESVLAEAA